MEAFIIFLDIDGVLNSQIFSHKKYLARKNSKAKAEFVTQEEYRKSQIDPEAIVHLNDLDTKFSGKIKWVLSSSWRASFSKVDDIQSFFESVGFTGMFIDKTPYLSYEQKVDHSVQRGAEIDVWLNKWIGSGNTVLNYAIIDDDSDMLLKQSRHFFHVDHYVGVSHNTTYKISRLFNNEY